MERTTARVRCAMPERLPALTTKLPTLTTKLLALTTKLLALTTKLLALTAALLLLTVNPSESRTRAAVSAAAGGSAAGRSAAAIDPSSPPSKSGRAPASDGVDRTAYPNGLVLLSKETHAAPVVSVWVYYKTGSRDEVQGNFGISHQVEHMMFKGTARLRPGDIDRLFSERGGANNAMTTQDYTAYNETLPSAALSIALQVEADRMEHSTMAATELEHEKTVVLSELEGDENSPAYKLDTAVTEAAFEAHPYHNPVGGYLYDIHRFTPDQLHHYYVAHYSPNNAVLVVVGDFNSTVLRQVVGRYFAQDPRRWVESHVLTPENPQTGERRVTVTGVGDTSYVEISYHVPETGTRDHYIMDVISTILGSGRSSRLHRALVQTGLATEVSAGDPDMKDPFLMQITATVAHGHTPDAVESVIETELDRLKTAPVTDAELEKTINQVKAAFVYRDDSVTSQASEIGLYASIGDYRYMDTYLQRIAGITADQIRTCASTFFTRENRTSGWFIPRPAQPGEAPPTGHLSGPLRYRRPMGSLEPPPAPPKPKINDTPKANDTPTHVIAGHPRHSRRLPALPPGYSDPKHLPDLIPNQTRERPVITRRVLPNGMTLLIYPNHSNADISISGSLRAGAFMDPPGKAGLANFTAAMLEKGTQARTEQQIAEQLDYVGASVDVTGGGSGTFFTAHCLDEDLPLTLDILADSLRSPVFALPTFDRVKNEILTSIDEADQDPASVATRSLYEDLYPEDYPLHWPVLGTRATVRNIGRQDLVRFHDRYYRPDLITLVVVGDIDPAAAIVQVERSFNTWSADGEPPVTEPAVLAGPSPQTRTVTNMPDKSEAVVAMGFRGITRRDPRYNVAYLMNLILGNDDFNSRLMKDIRDRKGLVYYAGSQWTAGILAGPWILEMETNPANVDRAIRAATLDITTMKNSGASDDELRLFKGWVTGSQALQLETNAGAADMLMQADFFGLGPDYIWKFPKLISTITRAQVQRAARQLLQPDNLVISIAGPYPPAPAVSGNAAPLPAAPAASTHDPAGR